MKVFDKATILGLMNGSSLDGLDICKVRFERLREDWQYEILSCRTVAYPNDLRNRLSRSANMPGKELMQLDVDFGHWLGEQITEEAQDVALIALHGHTVFHEPNSGFSTQIGNAQVIAKKCEKPVISDFRNADISLGGQGAPLVPFGEKKLFPEFKAFLNLGGICNFPYFSNDQIMAGDLGPFNQVFNYFARRVGRPFDVDGQIARSGIEDMALMHRWSQLSFFQQPFPKSLDNAFTEQILSAIDEQEVPDVLRTYTAFITFQIANMLNQLNVEKVLVSGGGAWNRFAMESLKKRTVTQVEFLDERMVDYKEALIFAFLGWMRWLGKPNVLSACTGASCDTSSGVVYTNGMM